MTLTIIFGAITLVGIAFFIWDHLCDELGGGGWRFGVGLALVFLFGIGFITSLIAWLPSHKNSEIEYQQLIQEKYTIEQMLDTDKNVDRIMLNNKVIEYNNAVIKRKTNSKRPIYRDYYSQDMDWDALELIEWE